MFFQKSPYAKLSYLTANFPHAPNTTLLEFIGQLCDALPLLAVHVRVSRT